MSDSRVRIKVKSFCVTRTPQGKTDSTHASHEKDRITGFGPLSMIIDVRAPGFRWFPGRETSFGIGGMRTHEKGTSLVAAGQRVPGRALALFSRRLLRGWGHGS